MNTKNDRAWIYLLIFCYVFIFIAQSAVLHLPFLKETEAREADTALSIYSSETWENYFAPYPNGDRIPTKPPVFHWLACAVGGASGTLNEFIIRLASALYGFGTVILTFLIARGIFDGRTAFFSGLVLMTSLTFLSYATEARVDIALLFFIVLAFYSFYSGFSAEMRRRRILFYLLFTFALVMCTMAKGPFGTAIPLAAIIPFMIVTGYWKRIINRSTIIYFILFLVPIALWLLVSYRSYGRGFFTQAWNETFARLSSESGIYTKDFHRPIYWYIPALLKGFFPWTLLVIPAFFCIFRDNRERANTGTVYLAAWFTAVFLMFSIPGYKRGVYILPCYPALAILTGRFISESGRMLSEKLNSLVFRSFGIIYIACFLAFAAASFIFLSPDTLTVLIKEHGGKSGYPNLLELTKEISGFYFIFFMVSVTAALIWLYAVIVILKKRVATFAGLIFAFILLVSYSAGAFILPITEDSGDSVKTFSRQVTWVIGVEDRLFFAPGFKDFSVIFYTRRHIPAAFGKEWEKAAAEGRRIYVIVPEDFPSESAISEQLRRLSGSNVLSGQGTEHRLGLWKID